MSIQCSFIFHFIICFFVNEYIYTILVKGTAPSPRAAHSATSVEAHHMVVYGGATGGSLKMKVYTQVAHLLLTICTFWI